MFAYNAGGVQDQSGQLIAQGANNAAMLQMQSMQQLGEDMGGVLETFAQAYKQKEQDKSDAKIYGNLLKFIAPAFGQQGDAILAEYNALENDRDKANYGRTAASLIGPASNALMAQGRLGVQQQQPIANARIKTGQKLAEEGPTFQGTALPAFGSK